VAANIQLAHLSADLRRSLDDRDGKPACAKQHGGGKSANAGADDHHPVIAQAPAPPSLATSVNGNGH
jgi:hypothetical protein